MRRFRPYTALGLLLTASLPVHSQERASERAGVDLFDFRSSEARPDPETLAGPPTLYRAAEAKLSENAFDPAAEMPLRRMEAAVQSIFNLPSLRFQRAVTQRILAGPQWGDVLIAEWAVDEPLGKGSIILIDTPYFSDYMLRLSGCKIGSRADLADFLRTLVLSWRPIAPLPRQNQVVQMQWPAPTMALPASFPRVAYFQGSQLGTSPFLFISDFRFSGRLEGKEWYLHFGIGKSNAVNPPSGEPSTVPAFIPERFPQLTDLVKSWGAGEIRHEVGHEVRPFEATPSFTDRRDQILIAELARRGLPDEQVADLLTDVQPVPENYELRLGSFIRGYEAGKGSWLDLFGPALKAYEGVGPLADSTVLNLFADAGRRSCPLEVEQQALDTLRKGVFSRGPFSYLGKCSTSLQTVATLEGLSAGDETFEKSKAGAIAMIRQRIANPGKRPLRPAPAK
jgi:hypothetical protein